MSPQAFALRPVRLSDLPTLKRWRSLPEIQRHLRHPHTSWWGHLRWWWGIRNHQHPTCRVWAVTNNGRLVGQAGLYYRMGPAAEVSVLVMDGSRENPTHEMRVIRDLLEPAAREWGLTILWAEVLMSAPLQRHTVFHRNACIYSDTYSTLYRWSIA